MSEGKPLHRLSDGEWYARAIREREAGQNVPVLGMWNAGGEVRIVFALTGRFGPLGDIVRDFVGPIWPHYQITEHCTHRYGVIVTVEEGPADAPKQSS